MKTFILQNIGALLMIAAMATVLAFAWLKFKPFTQANRSQRRHMFSKVRHMIGLAMLLLQEAVYLPRRMWRRLVEREANLVCFANVGEGTYEHGLLSRKADAAITTRFLLVKTGSDSSHIAVSGAADMPLGVATDEAEAAEDLVNVQLLGCPGGTVKMVASEAIAVDDLVYTAASGKVQDEPAATTVFQVGRALSETTADGQVIEVEPCFPLEVTFA